MSAIGHYLESEGIATASISLIREHSEVMRPPRALWVPFMLGRPLGAADNPVFQRRVLMAVLGLFERRSGPVLEDFPDDAPADPPRSGAESSGEACPVFFDTPPPARPRDHDAMALAQEIAQLAPWQALAAQRRGMSGYGLSGQTPAALGDQLAGFASGDMMNAPLTDWQRIKLAIDDLRTYYEEAASAQPAPLDASALASWFYQRTVAGRLLHDLRAGGMGSTDPAVRQIAERMLIPRAALLIERTAI